MGGASAPTLLSRIAAIGAESVGTEAPPTKAEPRRRRWHRRDLTGSGGNCAPRVTNL
ncbi:DUF6053 domain-containing protein [Lysobacter enzymogenes]|uniref:DUF6053 domain-containing protein n=1 Tax=Lysobacter enzymogenes TaxID=69 RepID=UPI003D18800E